jgi:hypothetical protein
MGGERALLTSAPLLLIVVILVLAGLVLWTQAIGAGWWPTPMKAVRRMLELVELKEDDTLYDLGSGDGRIVIEAAKKYGARGVGIEADSLRVAVSRLIVRLKGVHGCARAWLNQSFNVLPSQGTTRLQQDRGMGWRILNMLTVIYINVFSHARTQDNFARTFRFRCRAVAEHQGHLSGRAQAAQRQAAQGENHLLSI